MGTARGFGSAGLVDLVDGFQHALMHGGILFGRWEQEVASSSFSENTSWLGKRGVVKKMVFRRE